ncbi:uncharacterized protein CIMG_13149 [Coccidioides immitis RS]|uniref:Uncharacterized protein n=1 Tax=Coccidioides immitis (strain RS) TaxID=246410 RepID=J3KA91_COCIM|nr:uncharacterized protein CIMG_13149 [Coccidioides immitis RS]EAS31915.3 hypothetical protein CIMG_13149 [Coccidioides immitis RS]
MFVNLQKALDAVSVECKSSEPPDIIEEELLESESDKIEYKSPPLLAESSSNPAPLLMSSGLSSSSILESRLDHEFFLPTNIVKLTEEDNTLVQKLVIQLQTHHGCSTEAHAALKLLSMPTVSLLQMASWKCSDILEHASMSFYSIHGMCTSVESLAHEKVSSCPAIIDLEDDTILMPAFLHVMIDIDSAGVPDKQSEEFSSSESHFSLVKR